MTIALRYRDCWYIDGWLRHGSKCLCTPRDKFVAALNAPGAQE